MMKSIYVITGVAVIAIVGILIFANNHLGGNFQTPTQNIQAKAIATKASTNDVVPEDKIVGGGPPKDGIPSIDNPKFVTAKDADFLANDDVVIGLRLNNVTKAYPLSILVWHEIVNDKLGDTPVSVTYCPLCFTSEVFLRKINGSEVEFGTSGKLYNSNLVMYDRYTDSLWSQALGKGISGNLAGYELEKLPFDIAKWSDWKTLYPETLVLSKDTGFQRPYGTDPYGNYYTDPQIIFPVENKDNRLHPKEIIFGLYVDGSYRAYKLNDLESKKLVNDVLASKNILLVSLYPEMARAFDRQVDGRVLDFTYSNGVITDKQTNSQWNFEGKAIAGPLQGKKLERIVINPGFWFEWAAFHPKTEIYSG